MRSLKEQYAIQNQCLKERLEDILPLILKESEADVWLVASREYNEDPTFKMMVPADYLNARRVTMFVFAKVNGQVERYSLSLPDEGLDMFYKQEWKFGKEEQLVALKRLLERLNPQKIAVNTSTHFALCDGLTTGLYRMICDGLGEKWSSRMMSDDYLAMKFMEIRTKTELEYMPEVMSVAHGILERMYSPETIKPGITTTDDLVEFMKTEVNKLGLIYWFEPTMDLQRNGQAGRMSGCVIEKGDLLHCDFGLTYLNMCTDTQRLAYVAKDDETAIPDYLKEGMKVGNRFQDIVRSYMVAGATGNEVFVNSIQKAKKEGIQATLYSHPCNCYGHGPGPLIGLYSNQNPLPILGEVKLSNNTCFALELNVKVDNYYYYLEETVALTEEGVSFLYPNREQITFIKE